MIQTMNSSILSVTLIHWIGQAPRSFARLCMMIGLVIIAIFVMPVVVALNLLTKFLAAIADRDR
jgi:hypothetical protein